MYHAVLLLPDAQLPVPACRGQVPPYVAKQWREAIAASADTQVDEDTVQDATLGHLTLEGVSCLQATAWPTTLCKMCASDPASCRALLRIMSLVRAFASQGNPTTLKVKGEVPSVSHSAPQQQRARLVCRVDRNALGTPLVSGGSAMPAVSCMLQYHCIMSSACIPCGVMS